jgi:hypothetical protein
MEIMELNLEPKNADFFCQNCDFKCFKQSNWLAHLQTKKHIHRHNGNKMENAEMKYVPQHICECGKKYQTYSGLWKHSKTCNFLDKKMPKNAETTDFDTTDKDQLIMMLVKQNSELIKETSECKTMMMEIIKNGTNNWEDKVPAKVAILIKDNCLFDYPCAPDKQPSIITK